MMRRQDLASQPPAQWTVSGETTESGALAPRHVEEARAHEIKKLNELKDLLYDRQREMQSIQATLEDISAKNSRLEQDFEKEINNKNQNSKEIGQIINSISNIA